MNIFDYLYEDFRFEKDKPIRLFESFAGIGFQRMGMELAQIPHEVVGISEIDKFALKAYEAIHGECPNLGSITDIKGVDMPKEIDIFTYSFPCTDLSKAGKQKGLDNTRSGLVYEVLRILQELHEIDNLPKVLIMENVVDLVQTKFIKEFNEIQLEIEELGYTNYTQRLNAKNYGIAQNRDRVFMVSILGEYNYNFPKEFELIHRLKDYLEDEVDEKYYLSDKFIKGMMKKDTGKVNRLEQFMRSIKPTEDKEFSSTITTRETNVPTSEFIVVPEDNKKGYTTAKDGDVVYINRPHQKRGVVQNGMIQTLKTSSDVGVVVSGLYLHDSERFVKEPLEGLSRTLKANKHDSAALIEDVTQPLRIRKLTPRETGRLMGMNDTQIDKQQSVTSNAQMYKQHGNGIATTVIGLIIGMLWYEDEKTLRQTVMGNTHLWTRGEGGWGDCIRNTNKR